MRLVRGSDQLTLDFEPGLTERYPRMLDAIRHGAYSHRNPLKTIAADMDMSQSDLSRKLNSNPDDPRKFSVDDLESYLRATGDMTPIYWLIEKFLQDEEIKRQRAMSELAGLLPHLQALINQAGKVAA